MSLCHLVAAVLVALTPWVRAQPQADQQGGALASASLPQVQAGALLVRIFTESLRPDQAGPLGSSPSPEVLAAAMSPDEKEVARQKLREQEKAAGDGQLPEIQRGYELLGFTADGLRVDLMRQGRLPRSSEELTKQATQAWAEGRKEDAMRLAAEALARNPYDVRAYQILKLAPPKNIPGQMNLQDPFVQDSSVVKVDAPPETRAAPERPANAEAQALLRKTVDARKARDMDATLRFALDAMRADPTSTVVQQVYGVVIQDREKQMRRRNATLGFLNQAIDAENAGKRDRLRRSLRRAALVAGDWSHVFLRHGAVPAATLKRLHPQKPATRKSRPRSLNPHRR